MKKLIAFIGISVLFSGATFINKANYRAEIPVHQDTIKINKINDKLITLDSLLLQLKKYEKYNK